MSEPRQRNTEEEQKELLREVAEAENQAAQNKPVDVQWKPILNDMLVLMLVAVVLGLFSKFAMKPFEFVYDAQDLVSLANKSLVDFESKDKLDYNNLSDKGFTREFEKRTAEALNHNTSFINCRDNTGRTPLMWVCYSNYNKPQTLIYDLSSDVISESYKEEYTRLRDFHSYVRSHAGEAWQDFYDNEELYTATDLRRYYYTDFLLNQEGIDVAATDEDGFNALHWAAWSGLPFNCARLVERGIDINAPEGNGYTPLMLAALRGQAGAVRMLLALGADALLKNSNGETALDIARSHAAAYGKRQSVLYKLIYSEQRSKDYASVISQLEQVGAPDQRPRIDADGSLAVARAAVTSFIIQRDKAEEEEKAKEERKYGKKSVPAAQPSADDKDAPAAESASGDNANPAAEPADGDKVAPAAEQPSDEPAVKPADPAAEALAWLSDLEAAKQQAAAENKVILVDFTGSDWCGYCIQLRQNILDKPEFARYAQDKFVLLEVDMPRNPKFDQAQLEKNTQICRQYGVKGFPTVLVLTHRGDVAGGFVGGRPDFASVQAELDKALENAEALIAAESLEGDAQIAALAACYKALPEALRETARAQRDRIVSSDPSDISGLAAEVAAEKQMSDIKAEVLAAGNDLKKQLDILESRLPAVLPANKATLLEEIFELRMLTAESVRDLDQARHILDELAALKPEEKNAIEAYKARIFADPAAQLEKIKQQREFIRGQMKPES